MVKLPFACLNSDNLIPRMERRGARVPSRDQPEDSDSNPRNALTLFDVGRPSVRTRFPSMFPGTEGYGAAIPLTPEYPNGPTAVSGGVEGRGPGASVSWDVRSRARLVPPRPLLNPSDRRI